MVLKFQSKHHVEKFKKHKLYMETSKTFSSDIVTLTINEAADIASVSTDTIRNWIKSGYLISPDKKTITQTSFDQFMENIAGVEKLTSRANKLFKVDNNYKEITRKIDFLIQNFADEEIGIEYEKSLSASYRNREGIYYTPSTIARDMIRKIKIKPHLKFLDPCCGSGNFIIEAIRLGIPPENIYGFDTDENAVTITKNRIYQETEFESPNIIVGDFLEHCQRLKAEGITFDLIFTNPPWGKKMKKDEKKKYGKIFDCGDSLDTSSIFMAACFEILKKSGTLGFLLQEAFFNIAAYEDMRGKVLQKKILYIIDYGRAFKGLMTKAQAIIIKNQRPIAENKIQCIHKDSISTLNQSCFINNPKKIFNFWINEDDFKVIDRLYSIKHITLSQKAKWGLGIVTGNNKRFCKKCYSDGYIPVYKGTDILKNKIKEPSTFIPRDFSKFQQVAPLELYEAKEKLIYRFISSDLCFAYDDKQRVILNSANLLIPENIGISTKDLAALLNSDIINWLFKRLFNTHKILRSDLELLPIHVDYFKKYKEFSEKSYLDYLGIIKLSDNIFRLKS
ncbi:MAG: Modification methylase VspI [Spirochaetes bacterium ADurb.Bin218]|jgi:site-specific DNA-methyltransferase (adenine-specific)|nr:MAG: Modification methylase VspI [Spirochaetes bacterium ADurb.Bin218]